MESLRLRMPEGHRDLDPKEVVSVHFTPIGSLTVKDKPLVERDAAARAILQLIDFENPIIMDDKLGSILVGQIVITYKIAGEMHCRAFRVLGYSVLQDTCFPNTYYYASSGLRKLLTGRDEALLGG